MFRRYRQRRGPYALAQPSPVPSFVRSIVLLLIALVVLYFIGKGILHLFGGGGGGARTSIAFAAEDHGTVNVSLDGGLMQRADSNLKLYPGDKVSALSDGNGRLTFFDGSQIRTDNNTDLTIDQSETSTSSSDWQITLGKGAVWVSTPSANASSGTVARTIVTPSFTAAIPSSTQAEIEGSSLLVYSADGNGIAVTLKNAKQPVYIGEGQQLNLPATVTGDPLQYRSAIDPLAAEKPFVRESRAIATGVTNTVTGSGQTAIDPTAISVTSPADHAAVTTATVQITGTIGAKVDSVRVNGYAANVDKSQGTFSQEIAMSDSSQMSISIQALDSNGVVLDEVTRTVSKASSSLQPPTITSPASNGQTYRTQATQIDIKGTAPANAAGIMVNDYKLQLFRAGDTTWSYLASNALNNLHAGTNVFNVYTIDANGAQSAPATLTVLQEEGTVGVVATAASGSTAAPAQIDEKTLPQNSPLTPGVITVTGPQAGTQFIDNGSGDILLEGTTSKDTYSVWVNGYKLQLYKPGKTAWNYIAKTAFGTLKPGPNVYTINARDKDNKILDTFKYTVIYNP